MKAQKCGWLLLAVLAFLSNGCRTDKPPQISIICIGDGFGGADCVLSTGEKKYLKPSELKNFWMTTQLDMQNFSSWCYDTSPKVVSHHMERLEEEMHSVAGLSVTH